MLGDAPGIPSVQTTWAWTEFAAARKSVIARTQSRVVMANSFRGSGAPPCKEASLRPVPEPEKLGYLRGSFHLKFDTICAPNARSHRKNSVNDPFHRF